MPRWPLLVLVALALAAPAASAAREPCWQRVINDWYVDGRIDQAWDCNCVREAIEHLPTGGSLAYSDVGPLFDREERLACFQVAVNRVAAASEQKQEHTNWPARITAVVLMVITVVLLWWRRRGGRIRR